MKSNSWPKKRILIILGSSILGLAIGYAYWYFYGCVNGCTITSSWWRTSLYGILMGGLLGDMLHDQISRKTKKTSDK